jgi:hypothetical protein
MLVFVRVPSLTSGNDIYAKCGVRGRQPLRRFVGQWRQPATI